MGHPVQAAAADLFAAAAAGSVQFPASGWVWGSPGADAGISVPDSSGRPDADYDI